MSTKNRYLEVTYRNGRALAGYLYLNGHANDKSHRTVEMNDGLVVDYAADGRVIGVEITAPSRLTPGALNKVLEVLHETPVTEDEIRPLAA